MSEQTSPVRAGSSAGALLRAAREKQGLHIAALAAAIKVTPRRLEALEADRYDELLDPSFTRALAQTVCRTLKIDAGPVLALLPQQGVAAARLERVSSGLKTPFRDRAGPRDTVEWTWLKRPAFWATAAVLLAALVLYFLPGDWLAERMATLRSAPPPAAETVVESAPLPASAPGTQPDAAAPPEAPAAQAADPLPAASAPGAGLLVFHAQRPSWVEVRGSAGQALLFRTLEAGETVSLDGTLPMRVTIGNAVSTELRFRGEVVDLADSTRDNVARLELK